MSKLHFNTAAAELLISKIISDCYPARDKAVKSLGSTVENTQSWGQAGKGDISALFVHC